ncbi:P-loop nucleotide/nucleoside kinase family protein [Flindersiella endophytica]
MNEAPALIAIGGLPGAGKTTAARRLSAHRGMPQLSSDFIGSTLRRSLAGQVAGSDAFRAGYDLLFELAAEFLDSGGSVIVDITLGWAFQWERLDAIHRSRPQVRFVPLLLRCPREVCVERIDRRHEASGGTQAPARQLMAERPQVWNFVENLQRSDLRMVDASGEPDQVFRHVLDQLDQALKGDLR